MTERGRNDDRGRSPQASAPVPTHGTGAAGLSRRTQILSLLIAAAAVAAIALPEWLGKPDRAQRVRLADRPREVAPSPDRPTPTPREAAGTRGAGHRRIVVRTARNLPAASDVPTLVERLVQAGVTEAWVQCKQDESDEVTGGMAFYPSSIAPVAPGYEDDRLGSLITALADRGVRVAGWVPCFNDASAAATHPDWRAESIDPAVGERHPQATWLCPRHPEAVDYEASILAEVAERYPRLAALYTDFIRFDSDFSCVCDRCMAEVSHEHGGRRGRPVATADLLDAARHRSDLWQTWIDTRASAICDAVDTFRDRIEDVREGMWFGACVLPFSAEDYSLNTQSGQDLYEMARVGLDEIVLMGYWDDWGKSPTWLTRCVRSATELVRGECELSCLLDGDMSLRRTWLTLDAVREADERAAGWLRGGSIGYFLYGRWDEATFALLDAAEAGAARGPAPRATTTAVAVRVDTEPDYTGSYDAVTPAMIDTLVDLFDSIGMKATFVTCGRLAEIQPEPLRRAAAHGHEIACHAYDHEQLDALDVEGQIAATDKGLAALRAAGFDVVGFGSPRNSVTPDVRQHLLETRLAWDGSAAYDPATTFIDATLVGDHGALADDPAGSIIVLPFIVPNDWDALHIDGATPEAMLAMWRERLDLVVAAGEPVFILDLHQWIASRPDVLPAVRSFLEGVKARQDCTLMPVRELASRTREHIRRVEREAREAARRPPGSHAPDGSKL